MTTYNIPTTLEIFVDKKEVKLVDNGKIWNGLWLRLQGGYERGFYIDTPIPLNVLSSLREEELAVIEIPAKSVLGREDPSTEEWTSIEEGVPCTLRLAVLPRQHYYRGGQVFGEHTFEGALRHLL